MTQKRELSQKQQPTQQREQQQQSQQVQKTQQQQQQQQQEKPPQSQQQQQQQDKPQSQQPQQQKPKQQQQAQSQPQKQQEQAQSQQPQKQQSQQAQSPQTQQQKTKQQQPQQTQPPQQPQQTQPPPQPQQTQSPRQPQQKPKQQPSQQTQEKQEQQPQSQQPQKQQPATDQGPAAQKSEAPGSVAKSEAPGSVAKSEAPGSVPKSEAPGSAPKSEAPGSAPKSEAPGSAPKSEAPGSAQKSEACKESPPERRSRRRAICGESYDPAKDTEPLPEPIPKSPEERARLLEAISKIVVFVGLDDRQLNEVIDHLSDRQVKSGEVIVKQGDPGDYFYIIDSGKYEVDIDGTVVSSYDNKGSFGELALYYDQPRAATVKAVTEGRIWQINRTMFRRLVLRKAHELRQSYNTLIGSVPILQSLNAKERMTLCDALVPRLYKDGEVIVKQGDQADGMYFLEQGTVNVVVRSKEGKEEAVTTLTRGNYFGELALLTKKRRAATVVAKSDVRTAFLDVATFERLLGKCVDIMRRNIPHYEEQLVKIFGSKDVVEDLR